MELNNDVSCQEPHKYDQITDVKEIALNLLSEACTDFHSKILLSFYLKVMSDLRNDLFFEVQEWFYFLPLSWSGYIKHDSVSGWIRQFG